jgi:hypothetical protein
MSQQVKTILLIILIFILIGAMPTWGYFGTGYGWYGYGGVALLPLILIILLLTSVL